MSLLSSWIVTVARCCRWVEALVSWSLEFSSGVAVFVTWHCGGCCDRWDSDVYELVVGICRRQGILYRKGCWGYLIPYCTFRWFTRRSFYRCCIHKFCECQKGWELTRSGGRYVRSLKTVNLTKSTHLIHLERFNEKKGVVPLRKSLLCP